MILKLVKKHLPYLAIIFTNIILGIVFGKSYKVIYVPWDILICSMVCLKFTYSLKNRYNLLISRFWIIFFFLGILNINSAIVYDTTWDVNIHDASLLYFFNIAIFILSLIYFESRAWYKRQTILPVKFELNNKLFNALFLVFPFLFIYTLYKSLGFLPILSGGNFVEDMYNYDYGSLYGYKFICVYSFLIGAYFVKTQRLKYISILFTVAVLFIISVDGKRFLFLVALLAFLPVNDYLNRLKNPERRISYRPIILISLGIVAVYVSLLAFRIGSTDVGEWANLFINKIPFGIEFKDFVYSFERFNAESTKNYNFLMSNIGAFLNSGILSFLGYDKEQLTHMGSAYVWMDAYNINFGIRTGIVSELYFAYGILGSLLMILVAYFVNKSSFKLIRPSSVFELFQHAILYALYVLIITGQATVFFGCLSLIFYVYLFKQIVYFISSRRTNDIHSYSRI